MTARPDRATGSPRRYGIVVALIGFALLVLAVPLPGQMATADRLQAPGWWPTSRTAPRADYVGARVCVECHDSLSTQLTTAMARTAQRAEQSPVLTERDRLTFAVAHYSYSITRTGGRSIYAVTDGERTVSAPLLWALGAGNVGQTYVFERDGRLHEARASYYATVDRLGFTPARAVVQPRDVEDAMARPIEESEARRCFGCHTTASSTAAGFDLAAATPGVTCEACHGPGRAHVTDMEGSRPATPGTILNPSALNAVDSVDFCGACHATFWDVKLAGERGLAALRSQPHRLQSSACWGDGDDRITCVACHDPHGPLVSDTASYDAKCLSCHTTARSVHQPSGGRSDAAGLSPRAAAPACPTAIENCAGCHMPKYDVPEMHFAFTDHLIRIVRP